jgi:hypothetical protein
MYIMVLFLDNGWNLNATWTNDALCQYYRFCGQQSCETNGMSCQERTYNSLLSVCPSCDCKVTWKQDILSQLCIDQSLHQRIE